MPPAGLYRAYSRSIMTHENTKPSVDTALRMPSLFVSHGSPMFALEPGTTGPALRAFGERLRA